MHHTRVVRPLLTLIVLAAGWLLSSKLFAENLHWPLAINGRKIATQERFVQQYPLALGAFLKTESGWQLERQLKLNGTLLQLSYELPAYRANKTWHSIVQQLQEQGARLLFSCAGNACGSSSAWAHQVFGSAVAQGRDSSQRYSAFVLALPPSKPELPHTEGAPTSAVPPDYVAVYLSRNSSDQSRPYRLILQRISSSAVRPKSTGP